MSGNRRVRAISFAVPESNDKKIEKLIIDVMNNAIKLP
jgi:hypothetical protein